MGSINLPDLDIKEEQHQRDVVEWFYWQYPQFAGLLAAFNNSEYVSDPKKRKMVGAKRRAIGVVAGMPDLILLLPRAPYHAYFIEMKTLKGKLSDKQKSQHIILKKAGYKVDTAYGFEHASLLIKDYIAAP